MKTMHWVIVGLGGVVTACHTVASMFPQYQPLCAGVAQVCAGLVVVLGVVSPAVAAPPVSK